MTDTKGKLVDLSDSTCTDALHILPEVLELKNEIETIRRWFHAHLELLSKRLILQLRSLNFSNHMEFLRSTKGVPLPGLWPLYAEVKRDRV